MKKMLLIEPFFAGSHRQWAEQYRRYSRHQLTLLTLPGRHWKWRMFGGAVHLAREAESLALRPDLLLATDMLDLTAFLALTRRRFGDCPAALYFHENQITYPWSPNDADPELGRNHQYGFLNYTSALAADHVLFNSGFHRRVFLEQLAPFLKRFPDRRDLDNIDRIEAKSDVLPLGLELKAIEAARPFPKPPEAVILWNHRWEYDKDPDTFFQLLFRLKAEGLPFRLVVLGEKYLTAPPVFEAAREQLQEEIIHWGYAENQETYRRWLRTADLLPVTSRQEFFGAGVVEAIAADCYPLLPDRLSYPEHLPAASRAEHLYADEATLYRRLRHLVTNIVSVRQRTYRHFVAKYDWSILAKQYDDHFEKFAT